MASRKDDTPSVATYADHEVITPPHELRKAVALAAAGDDDPVARAEAALVAAFFRIRRMDGSPNASASKRRARMCAAAGLYRAHARRAVPRRA